MGVVLSYNSIDLVSSVIFIYRIQGKRNYYKKPCLKTQFSIYSNLDRKADIHMIPVGLGSALVIDKIFRNIIEKFYIQPTSSQKWLTMPLN